MNTTMLAGYAVFIAAFLGGIAPIFAKYALQEFGPFTVSFLRFGVAALCLLPFTYKVSLREITRKNLKHVVISSFLFAGNILFFINGIQFTTSIVSQLLYLFSPLIVLLLSLFIEKQILRWYQLLGMVLGFSGAILIVINSTMQYASLTNSLGTFYGNVMVFSGMFFWSLYLIYSKRHSTTSPIVQLSSNVVITMILSLLFALYELSQGLFFRQPTSLVGISNIIMLGLVNSICMFFLYQWALKSASSFTISSSVYISPLAAALLAIPLLHEQISTPLLLSCILIIAGSYLNIIYPQILKRKKPHKIA